MNFGIPPLGVRGLFAWQLEQSRSIPEPTTASLAEALAKAVPSPAEALAKAVPRPATAPQLPRHSPAMTPLLPAEAFGEGGATNQPINRSTKSTPFQHLN